MPSSSIQLFIPSFSGEASEQRFYTGLPKSLDRRGPTVPASGYTCLELNNATPDPREIVGWEHTVRAQVIGNAQKDAILLLVLSVIFFVAINLYYRGVVFIICGPRD